MTRTSRLTNADPKKVLEVLNRKPTILEAALALNTAPGTLYRFIRKHKLQRIQKTEWVKDENGHSISSEVGREAVTQ
jgi:IS30 family transposase